MFKKAALFFCLFLVRHAQSSDSIQDKLIIENDFSSQLDSNNNITMFTGPCDSTCKNCFGPKPTQCIDCAAGLQLNERLLQCETPGKSGFNSAMKITTIIFIVLLILLALLAPTNSKGVFYATFFLSEFQIIDAFYYIYMDKPDFLREVLRAFSVCNFSFFWNGLAGITENGKPESHQSEYFDTHQNIFPYFKELGITGSFIYRGGTAFFITLTVFILTWVYLIAHKGCKVRIPEVVKHIFEWNLIIRIFLLFVFPLTEAVIQQLLNISFSTGQDVIGVICAFFTLIFFVFATWMTTSILRRERLQESYSQYRYGALIDEVELGMDNVSHYFHLILAGRRAAIALIIAVVPQGLVQILLIMALMIAAIVFINFYYGFSDEDLLNFFLFKEGTLIGIEICLIIVYFGGSSSVISSIFSVIAIGMILFTILMGMIFVLLKRKSVEPKIQPCYKYIADKICCVYFVLLTYRRNHLDEEDEDGYSLKNTGYLIVES